MSDTRDEPVIPPEQDPESGYPTSTGVENVDDDEHLPPPGEELEAD